MKIIKETSLLQLYGILPYLNGICFFQPDILPIRNFLLVKIRFEKPAARAEISMLPLGSGKPLQRTIALTSQNTVIGGSPQADFTVAGIPNLKESHATIVQNEKAGTFTLVSDEEVRVNNRMTKKRKLNPGDVINIEGATIVFDAPEQ